MNRWALIRRSAAFHWRSHLGVVLGVAVASAALVGALIVGDSVRESLRERALERLGGIHFAWTTGDRLLRQQFANDLAARLTTQRWRFSFDVEPLLVFPASVTRQDASARANQISVIGVTTNFLALSDAEQPRALKDGEVLLNESLAQQLNARSGDEVVLRVRKPSALSLDAPITPQSELSVALRLRVAEILSANALGNFSLRANQVPPNNAFVSLTYLADKLGVPGRANVVAMSAVRDGGPRGVPWWARFLPRLFDRLRGTNQAESELTARDIADYTDQLPLTLEDLQLHVAATNGQVELRTDRVFLDRAIVAAATNATLQQWRRALVDIDHSETNNLSAAEKAALRSVAEGKPLLTYLANLITAGTNSTPYSMVCAAGPPYTPGDSKDDQVVINEWLSEDLKVRAGDAVTLTWFAPDSSAQLIEKSNTFRVHSIVPLTGVHADRTLMPDFPGIAKAESTHDWDAGFPLTHKIRPKDDAYWKTHRGTPKAFLTLHAGQEMWANRFGNLTGMRWAAPTNVALPVFARLFADNLLNNVRPEQLGIQFQPVREQALQAATQSQDFGGLFIGFSFFLIIAALILVALLFQFGVEQRATEIGTLLAIGFTARRVRTLFLIEGLVLSVIGSAIGCVAGLVYARLMLRGLTTIWRSATNTSSLTFHASAQTSAIGFASAVIVGLITIWLVLRKQARQPARVLLAREQAGAEQQSRSTFLWRALSRIMSAPVIALGAAGLAAATVAAAVFTGETSNPEYFFSAGSLALIAGIAAIAWVLRRVARRSRQSVSRGTLTISAAARRRSRSIATVALISSGVFLIASIGVFRLDADANAWKRSAGTGGFALIGQSALPLLKDLRTPEGRDALGLDEKVFRDVRFVLLRVREGDDASCLNLNRAQQPRVLGVDPRSLADPPRFSFTAKDAGWRLLENGPNTSKVVPAIGDAASIQWALGKKLGDSLPYPDEQHGACDLRLVGALQNSIFQGSLIISEREFVQHFPSVSGYRMFLIDCPSNALPQVSAELSRGLQDYGFEVTPTAARLAALNAVQNTYLNTFQVLGGLGLVLGSAGLGIVVLRNVLERRHELAVLLAIGFRRRAVQRLVLAEHAALLGIGLAIGVLGAIVAVLPALLAPRSELPVLSLAATLFAVFIFGLVSTWAATRFAVGGELLESLRNE